MMHVKASDVRRLAAAAAALWAAAWLSGAALAQSGGAAAGSEKQAEKQAEKPKAKKGDPLPGLDDLLGLPEAGKRPEARPGEGAEKPGEGAAPAEGAADPLAGELERKLSAQELAEKFEEAVRQMGESADRLEKSGDVGLATQRLHEAILRNLDVLIKQSNDGQGGSSSSSSSSQSQQQSSAEQRRAGQQSKPQQGENEEAGQGENQGERMPPAMTDAERRGQLDTARAAWGSLPERVRDSLMQGSSDYFSALYEAATEAYYKKLAEEARE